MATKGQYVEISTAEDPAEEGHYQPKRRTTAEPSKYKLAIAIFLALSILCNGALTIYLFLPNPASKELATIDRSTPYAGLTWNTPSTFTHNGHFDNANRTTNDLAWAQLSYDPGNIALSDACASAMNLPLAQRFLWDEDKGLYFVNAYHSIHCLKVLRLTIAELDAASSPTFTSSFSPSTVSPANSTGADRRTSYTLAHASHCLDALLQDVLCFADDTPRYQSREHEGQPGEGQGRMCRDWRQLEAWAKGKSAYWRDVHPTEKIDTLERYRFCPEGSEYKEGVEGWFEERERDRARSGGGGWE